MKQNSKIENLEKIIKKLNDKSIIDTECNVDKLVIKALNQIQEIFETILKELK